MACFEDRICLKKIIRPDPQDQERAKLFMKGIHIVIDPPEEDLLIGQRNPGPDQQGACLFRFPCQLRRMIEMGVDKQRAKPGQEEGQSWCYPRRESGGDPGVDPESSHA